MKSILFIIPYFGKWPVWFDAHLISIEKNSSINWLIVTDCEIPENKPSNIEFVTTDFKTFNKRVNEVIGLEIPLSVRKICDIRPAFGEIFEKELEGYDFWGFCDVDIIWGDIRKFLKDEFLEQNEIISSLHEMISGHFSVFKNTSSVNQLYRIRNVYMSKFLEPTYTRFEEYGFAELLKELIAQEKLKVFWGTNSSNEELLSVSHQEYYLDKWLWKDGKMIDVQTNNEIMYLHFINWKPTMKFSEIKFAKKSSFFYISYTGIHYNLHSKGIRFLNYLKNLLNGYWINEKRRYKKMRYINYIKRIKLKIKMD